jgi:hypothetical protein
MCFQELSACILDGWCYREKLFVVLRRFYHLSLLALGSFAPVEFHKHWNKHHRYSMLEARPY